MKTYRDSRTGSTSSERAMYTRDAVLLWFGSSLIVWAAIAMSAVWIT